VDFLFIRNFMQLSPSHITNIPAASQELFQQFGVPTEARFDRIPISLEKRGLTSQIAGRSKAAAAQQEFWENLSVFTETIVAKLDGCGRSDVADEIRFCHSEVSYRRCRGCSTVSKFYNRCEKKWCPMCAPRLSRERKQSLQVWSREVKQPKHVVLTTRNSGLLTKEHVQHFKKCFSRLRRTNFALGWRGGFYAIEVTNESRGWHLHLHALIDADWIDQAELARQWAKIVGQDFAIVYVADARKKDYLGEVCKYLVKGSQLATWSGEDIAAFVDAFQGVRTFQPFGTLMGVRKKVRELIKQILDIKPACECGCAEFQILSPNELEEFMLTRYVKFRDYESCAPQ